MSPLAPSSSSLFPRFPTNSFCFAINIITSSKRLAPVHPSPASLLYLLHINHALDYNDIVVADGWMDRRMDGLADDIMMI